MRSYSIHTHDPTLKMMFGAKTKLANLMGGPHNNSGSCDSNGEDNGDDAGNDEDDGHDNNDTTVAAVRAAGVTKTSAMTAMVGVQTTIN